MHQIRGNYSNEAHYCAEITISHVAAGKKIDLFLRTLCGGKTDKSRKKQKTTITTVLVVLLADTMGPSCSGACFGPHKKRKKKKNIPEIIHTTGRR